MDQQVIKQEPLSISNMQEVMEFGNTLKNFIKKNSLSTVIQGKSYAHVDGWKFAGANFGLTAITDKPVKVSKDGEYIIIGYVNKEFNGSRGKYTKEVVGFTGLLSNEDAFEKAKTIMNLTRTEVRPFYAYETDCDIIRLSDGVRVGSGTGFCSNMESAKSSFDEYSVNSMSQTRAIGKGYRNLIGYVMNSAGMEGTPAEEMEEMKQQEKEQKKPESKGKKEMSPKQFKEFVKRANKGEVTMEQAEDHFHINDDQRATLNVIFKKPEDK